MRAAIRHIVGMTYKPLLEKYLAKTRIYHHEGLTLSIPPGIFHPQFFFSTKLLLQQVKMQELKGRRFLELGCGSGLISLVAAKKGASVTSSDINPVAIEQLKANSHANGIELRMIESDLFRSIPPQQFDIIAINPPFYKKYPVSSYDYAWCCGEKGEYFQQLFAQLGTYMTSSSIVLMILFEGCDMEMIRTFARENGAELNCIKTTKNLLESNSIYQIIYHHA